jgi:hypothetical protein
VQRLKLTLIPISIGIILLFLSWLLNYPVLIDSPYDFVYNHFSYLYWIGLAILFVSFFIVAMKTENNSLRWAMAVGTVLLMFSQAYFYYFIPGSDTNQFRGLTEHFISTGDLSLNQNHYYYQWPLFFILNKMAISVTGLDLRYLEFIMYGAISSIITSFVYLQVSRIRTNAYTAVMAFFIILIPFFVFEFWSPFALSLCLILLLLYLDNLSGKREVLLAMVVVFVSITFTHILVPLFFVIYLLVMYFLKKSRVYLNLFVITSIIYSLVLSYGMLANYIKQLTIPYFLEIGSRIATLTGVSSIAPQPYVDVIAQLFSRTAVITTALITGLGFIILFRRRKLRETDYAMLLVGAMFAVGLLVSPSAYPELSNRSYFLICIPASLGASYLCESRLKRYFRPIFLVLLVLFTFALMHQTFNDVQIFFQTKAEYQCTNFMMDHINWTVPTSILSHFRVEQYLKARSSSDIVRFGDDIYLGKFPEDMADYTYVVYTIGLAKSFLAANLSVEESFREFEVDNFNLIYDSGNFSCVFSK